MIFRSILIIIWNLSHSCTIYCIFFRFVAFSSHIPFEQFIVFFFSNYPLFLLFYYYSSFPIWRSLCGLKTLFLRFMASHWVYSRSVRFIAFTGDSAYSNILASFWKMWYKNYHGRILNAIKNSTSEIINIERLCDLWIYS